MCGIAGIIGRPNEEALNAMLSATSHRGPDDRGVYSDDYVSIGMNRLAIIDVTAAGHQPMPSDDERYWIVYNGEIYNFDDVRQILKKKGVSFHSTSDTEVLLKAYIALGENCLELFRGMFAFVIYDRQTKDIFGARDRFGVKPFYYTITNDSFIFASEIKALLSSGYVDLKINGIALEQLLTFGSVLSDTIVQNILVLQPGSLFCYRNKLLQVKKYWKLEIKSDFQGVSYEDAKSLVREKLKESVALRWVSERPVGLFLSSGIDSVSILASTHLLGRDNVNTFTVGFVDEDDKGGRIHQEGDDAKKIAAHFGFRNQTVSIEGSRFQELFDEFVMAIDQPSIDGLNTFLITKYARQHLVVALSGLGGDELMNGYLRDRAVMNWSSGFKILPDKLIEKLNVTGYRYSNNSLLMKVLKGLHPSDLVWNYFISRNLGETKMRDLLLSHNADGDTSWRNLFGLFDRHRISSTPSRQVSLLELNTYMTPQLLRDMDAVSMYNSMEVRFPLIDHQFAELIFSLEDSFKVNLSSQVKVYREGHYSYQQYGAKRVLIDAFKDYLPKDYIQNKKKGFNLPIQKWLGKYFYDDIIETLHYHENRSENFAAKGLKALREDFIQHRKPSSLLWAIFLFMRWEDKMKEIKVPKLRQRATM